MSGRRPNSLRLFAWARPAPLSTKLPPTAATLTPSSWYEGAVRKRKAFADLGLAEIHANAQVNNLSRARRGPRSCQERSAWNTCADARSDQGYALVGGHRRWRNSARRRDAQGRVAGGCGPLLRRARRCWTCRRRRCRRCSRKWSKAKRAEGCSERYIQDLESRCGKFAREFPRDDCDGPGPEIKTWLQGLTRETSKVDKRAPRKPVTNRTRNNFRLCIQTLFSFAKAQRVSAGGLERDGFGPALEGEG